MKILIDLQALQTESANRGIGRYAGALTSAFIDELRDHEIFVLLHEHAPCGPPHSYSDPVTRLWVNQGAVTSLAYRAQLIERGLEQSSRGRLLGICQIKKTNHNLWPK